MEVIKIHSKTDNDGKLKLEVPTEHRNTELDMIIVIDDKSSDQLSGIQAKYDFSDLVGKLKWKGDPVIMQQQLRDKWE